MRGSLPLGHLIPEVQELLTVEDLAMTVYHQLGINGDKELMAPGNRPIEIIDDGKVRKELIG